MVLYLDADGVSSMWLFLGFTDIFKTLEDRKSLTDCGFQKLALLVRVEKRRF